jgi:WD40 repeat protein
MVSVSEDCMMKLWDVKSMKQSNDDVQVEPLYTYRGHTGPLFAVTANNGQLIDDTLIYSAGMEGVIRIWKVPKLLKESFPPSNG